MSGFERSLKHWFWYQAKTSAVTVLMIIGICAVTAFFDGNFMESFFKMLPGYMAMMAAMTTIVYGFSNITVNFPLSVSFSARRKNSLIAMNIAQQVIALILFAIAALSYLYGNPDLKEAAMVVWPGALGAAFLLLFFGNIVGIFSNKFGRTFGMIAYVIFVFLMVIVAMCVINIAGRDDSTIFINSVLMNVSGWCVIAGLVGFALDILSVWIMYLTIKKKDISF